MICPGCDHYAVDVTTGGVLVDGFEEYRCPGCGAHWKERDGKITWAAAPTRQGYEINPAHLLRDIMVRAGYDVDEEEIEAMRRYCDEPVDSVEPLQALVPEHRKTGIIIWNNAEVL